jgi:peptidyl-prolyl cis-trans isomerase SurA
MQKLIKYFIISFFYLILLNQNINSKENKILFKVNNEIITSLDIFSELKYLAIINDQFKNTEKKQAFEIAKRSLIREKIKEIHIKKVVEEIKLEEKFLNNVLINYFKEIEIKSTSEFEKYFTSINIDPNLIKKKITIEILWNELIFKKYNQNVKSDRQTIIDNLN